jgi:hypothetical protein
MWYTPIAVGTVLLVGIIVSYLTHPLKPGEVNPKYLISIGDVCCCCLPEGIRRRLRFGVDYDNHAYEKDDGIEMTPTEKKRTLLVSNSVSPAPSVSKHVDRAYGDSVFQTRDEESHY